MITELQARSIAGLWHDGQWSALYAFCSSGHLNSATEIEVNRNIRMVSKDSEVYSIEDRKELLDLKEYITSKLPPEHERTD